MKNLLVTLMLSLGLMPGLIAADSGLNGMADGVGAGGTGGNPNARGTSSVGTMNLGLRSSAQTSSLMRTDAPKVEAAPVANDSTVLVDREGLLKAVDAALNSNDLSMQINEKPRTVRLQKFDLSRGILHGKVLETNRPIRLIDETKADAQQNPGL